MKLADMKAPSPKKHRTKALWGACLLVVVGLTARPQAALAQQAPRQAGSAELPPENVAQPRPEAAAEPAKETGAAEPTPAQVPEKPPKKKASYAAGLNYQFLIVPQFLLKAFLEAAKSGNHNLYRHTFGVHFVRRKGALDIIVRLMFGFMMSSQDDGNWLGRGHDWAELDYTEFHDLNFLWADVTFIHHWKVAPKLYLGAGGGIGLGVLLGSVYTTPSSLNGTGQPCSSSNYDDCSVCHPVGATCTSSSCKRSSLEGNPDREKSDKVPPVLPALNGVFSIRYDFWKHMSARFNTGLFLPGFFSFELSLEWVF